MRNGDLITTLLEYPLYVDDQAIEFLEKYRYLSGNAGLRCGFGETRFLNKMG